MERDTELKKEWTHEERLSAITLMTMRYLDRAELGDRSSDEKLIQRASDVMEEKTNDKGGE